MLCFLNLHLLITIMAYFRFNFYLVDLIPLLYSDFSSALHEEFSFGFSTIFAAPLRVFRIVLSLSYPEVMVELVLLISFTI